MDTNHHSLGLVQPATSRVKVAPLARPMEARTGLTITTGRGTSIAQHGELLQGLLTDRHHRGCRFLISLPCDRLYSTVTFTATAGGCISVEPTHKIKVCNVVKLTLDRFGLQHVGGLIHVESNIKEGKGYGSSTSDCVAGALAVAAAAGRSLAEDELAELVVAAETASDNFMFKRAVLFAHREGRVLEDLGARLPSLEVLGIDTDVDGAVYTLDFPAATYDWRQIQHFQMLVAGTRRAIHHGDRELLGRIATSSATINQQFLPKPMFKELSTLAVRLDALGIAVAHSGTLLSMLFDPSDPKLEAKTLLARRELNTLGIDAVMRFRT